jgi:hypothetical protein
MMMLDLYAGRLGWAFAFLARGWKAVAVDLVPPPVIHQGVIFRQMDVLKINLLTIRCWEEIFGEKFAFACASSPCEKFSVHGMKHFHPNPPYPEEGIRLFNYTRNLLEELQIPYVMENVRAAQQFVGKAVHHCGPFYLWGSGVPHKTQLGFWDDYDVPSPLPKGVTKGIQLGGKFKGWAKMSAEDRRRNRKTDFMIQYQSGSKERLECTAKAATIPPELANCVADYAERLLEQRAEMELR